MHLTLAVGLTDFSRLKETGISISIDDFGTGFSSLAYLKELDIDFLKIDQSFLSNLLEKKKDQAIVSTIY